MSKNLYERRIANLERVATARLQQRYGRICVPLALQACDFAELVPHLSPVGRDFKTVEALPDGKNELMQALHDGKILLLHGVAWACVVQEGDDASRAIAETQTKIESYTCSRLA